MSTSSETAGGLPLITIGVSAYNRKDYLKLSLDSLLAQSYPAYEIIVVDDGSTDGTAEMMQECYPRDKFPQITFVRQENGGDASAKNHAVRLAGGEYVVFNDSDDLFLPDTLQRLYDALPPGEKNACSYGTYQTIDTDGNFLPTKRKVAKYPSGCITGDLLRHIVVNNCGTLIPRALFDRCGGFDSALRVSHDYALMLELSCHSNFYAVEKPVFLRRRHGSNISSASYAKIKIVLEVFEKFLSRHPEIAGRFASVIRRRRSDLHSKLYREAKLEKLQKEAVFHAREAFRYHPGLKTFFRMITA